MSREYRYSKRASNKKVAYSLAAGATAAAFGASEGSAEIQYLNFGTSIDQGGFLPAKIGDPNSTDPTEFDVFFENYVFTNGPNIGNYQGIFIGYIPGAFVGFQSGSEYYVSALTAGTYIDKSDLFYGTGEGILAFGANKPNAEFNDVEDAYFGFSFPLDKSPPPAQRESVMGWARVTIDNAAGTFILKDIAYEDDPNAGITVGDAGFLTGDLDADGDVDGDDFLLWQRGFGDTYNFVNLESWAENYGTSVPPDPESSSVPEPGTLGLLAAGAAGLVACRRRRSFQHLANLQAREN